MTTVLTRLKQQDQNKVNAIPLLGMSTVLFGKKEKLSSATVLYEGETHFGKYVLNEHRNVMCDAMNRPCTSIVFMSISDM